MFTVIGLADVRFKVDLLLLYNMRLHNKMQLKFLLCYKRKIKGSVWIFNLIPTLNSQKFKVI